MDWMTSLGVNPTSACYEDEEIDYDENVFEPAATATEKINDSVSVT